MIKYKQGEPLDLLPSFLKENEDFAAISYAIKKAVAILSTDQEGLYLRADIDHMRSDLLNLLALELDAPYYDEQLDIETRRKLVKKALLWRFKAGTKATVEELVKTVFGKGEVTEWFEFEEAGTPGEFDVSTSAQLTPEEFEQFTKIISRVKNATSHLRSIKTEREVNHSIYPGAALVGTPRAVIHQTYADLVSINHNAYIGTDQTVNIRSSISQVANLQSNLNGKAYNAAANTTTRRAVIQ